VTRSLAVLCADEAARVSTPVPGRTGPPPGNAGSVTSPAG
jgi:hypothetical protein